MKRTLSFCLVALISFGATASESPFMSCGEGDYLLSNCETGFVCVNNTPPLSQQVKYLNDKKDGSAMLVSLPMQPGVMIEWEKLPSRQRLYIYDYPDGVHTRLVEKVSCKWIRNK